MILTLSPSGIDTAESCLRAYDFSKLRKLGELVKNEKLQRGTLFHGLLELYYKAIKAGAARKDALISTLENGRGELVDLELPAELVERIFRTFREYCFTWENDNWEPIAIEAPLTRVLYEEGDFKIVFEAVVDLLAKVGEIALPIDHKSHEKIDYPILLDNQILGITWALDETRFCINQLIMRKNDQEFHRPIFTIQESIIEEWRNSIIYLGLEIKKAIEGNYFPPRYKSCKFCSFKDVCQTVPENREWKLKVAFTERKPYDIYVGREKK